MTEGKGEALEAGVTAGVQPPCRFALLRRDLQRYFQAEGDGYPGLLKALRIFLDTPGMQAVVVFRFCSWVERSVRLRLLRYPLKVIAYVLQKLCIILWGISIDDRAQIGGGLYIGHFGGIIIGPVKMGRDCSVARNVAIGRRAGSGASGVPTIGDRVWIGAGSLLFDGITVGDGVTIGPLTVVGRNLPSRVLVMGNPMRLLRKNYDNSAEVYGKAGPPAE